jgi:hypothetical protein
MDEYGEPTHIVSKVKITRSTHSRGPHESNPFVSLQQTCRQIYTETAKLPFSRINQFWYLDERALDTLILWIKPSQIQAITKLFFFVVVEDVHEPSETGDMDLKRIRNLGMLTGVKHISVAVAVRYSGCVPQSMKDAALRRIQGGLGPKVLEFAPKNAELVFETYKPED